MKYIIDGYNLLFKLFKTEKILETQRDDLILFLKEKNKLLKTNILLVFDAHKEADQLTRYSYIKGLKVAYTPKNQIADEYIEEKVFLSKKPYNLTIVTDDKKLKDSCKRLKAKVLSLDDFFLLIEKANIKKNKISSSKTFEETEENIERLLKIFEEKFEEEDDFY